MPVTVSIPTRIRIDREAASGHAGWIADAVKTAVQRALEASREAVLEKRGGYLPVQLHTASFAWSGQDLEHVPLHARRSIEAEVSRAIADAAKGSDVLKASEAIAPLSEAPAEPFDPQRYDFLMEEYTIPSYEGGKKGISTKPAKPAQHAAVAHAWRPMTSRAFDQDVRRIIADLARQWGAFPSGVPRGVLLRRRVGKASDWMVIIGTKPLTFFSFDSFGHYVYHGEKANPPFTHKTDMPAPQKGTATRWKLAGGTVEALTKFVNEHMGLEIEVQVRRVYHKGTTDTVDEYANKIAAAVDREVQRRVDAVMKGMPSGGSVGSIVRVQVGASYILFAVPTDQDANLHWENDANLWPVSSEVKPAKRSAGKGQAEGESGEVGGGGAGKTGNQQPGKRSGTGVGTGTGTGAGSGKGAGSGSGQGHGSGDGTGTDDGEESGIVYAPENAPKPGEHGGLFPPGEKGGITLTCKAFDGEPSVDELGSDGAGMFAAIQDIARRLQISECKYAANFCLNAALAIGGRSGDVSRMISQHEPAGFTQPTGKEKGNLGPVDFRPVASPSIQFLRHLAGIVPSVARLMRRVHDVYSSSEHRSKVKTQWGSVTSWSLHFMFEFSPAMDQSVGYIFVTACQAMLMQLLQASKDGIDKRIARFNAYAPIFERLLVTQLTQAEELTELRDHLRLDAAGFTVHQFTQSAGGDVTAGAALLLPGGGWFTAAHGMSAALLAIDKARFSKGHQFDIVREGSNPPRIRDSLGILWSMEEIEHALVAQRGLAEDVDPLVKQITSLPSLMARFRTNPQAIREELWRLLMQMRGNNTEMLKKTRESAIYAFRATTIHENIADATIARTAYALTGIHDQAHQQIGEFFQADPYYGTGVDGLFSAELGRKELTEALIMIEIVMLSVLCPPLGFAVGVGVAVSEVRHAHERERMFGALLDPELVLTRAEVEMELFAAYLGLALSLIPEAGTVAGALGRGGKVAMRAGLRMGAKSVARYVGRKLAKQIMEAAARNLLEAFVKEVVTNVVMDKIMQKVMEPILAHIEREAQITESVGGSEGARFIEQMLANEARKQKAQSAGAHR